MLRRILKIVLPVTLGGIVLQSNAWASDINLLEAYQQAFANNYSLKGNYNTYRAQDAAKNVSLGALFPNLSLTGTLSSTTLNSNALSGDYQSAGYQFNLTQVVFNYGVYKTYKASKQTALQAEATYHYQQQQLMLNVASAYFNILLAEEQLDFAKANVKALKSALEQATNRFKVGVATNTDVKQAEASYYNGTADQVTAQNNLDTAYYSLFQLTGKLEKNLAPLKSNVQYKEPSPANINYWVKQAEVHNQSYQSQKYQENASYETMQSTYGAFLPTVSLVAQYSDSSYYGNEPAYTLAGYSNHSSGGYVGLSLTWNIFNGGTDFATQVQNARLYTAQEFNSLNSLRTLIQNTRTDYINIKALVSQVEALKQSVKASDLAYQQYVEQYNVGTATITDVLDQLTTLYQSKSNLAQAKYNYFIGLLQLKLDAGTLSIKDIQQINSQLQYS